MARPKRTYKLKWRSKKANHGRKPNRGHHHHEVRRSMHGK